MNRNVVSVNGISIIIFDLKPNR